LSYANLKKPGRSAKEIGENIMKVLTTFLLSLVFVTSLAEAQAWRDVVPPRVLRWAAHTTPVAAPRPLAVASIAAVPRAALPPNVIPATCPEPNSVCGFVRVPLDRKHPQGQKIGIYFEQYFHSNAGPAVSAIMVNLGGPGSSTTDSRDYFQFGLFAANMDAHDLLLVDDRGRGQSGAIDCPELQHGGTDFATAEKDCAAQLGAAASRYGSGDIAEDMNDVRAALGYNLIDYLGASWGGADAIAFATRHPEHVRSLVLDSPVGPPVVIPYTARQSLEAHSIPLVITNLCARSLLCAPDHPHPTVELSALIQAVRAHPVEGNSHDASGNPLHVRVDERTLLDFTLYQSALHGNYTTQNEVLAAYDSLKQGDAVPLLRLAAEGLFTIDPLDYGDPTGFSLGAFYATGCSDVGESFAWSDTVSGRMESYNEDIATLSNDYFAPFSKTVGGDIRYSSLGMQCFWWQKPTPSSPIAKHNAVYPPVPTLVLAGDIDDQLPAAANKAVADLFPNRTFVPVANSRHETTGWTSCGTELANRMIETLSPGDTSCANTPEYYWPAVGRFPLLARSARPAAADSSGTNRIDAAERKVVSVAVATATDVLQRFYIGSGAGVGLRGGKFSSNGNAYPIFKIKLTNCAFSEDVIVNGKISWNYFDGSLTSDLTVSGPGTAGGNLHVTGFWEGFGPVGYFQVNGTLAGKHVAVRVPEG
jgi:pimeloyl-ACP methyl ester carboxylesterase